MFGGHVMLNMNSPTVQSMLRNNYTGLGNIPMYYGSPPTIETSYVSASQVQAEQQQPAQTPIQQQPTTPMTGPFPSPKEMVTQSGYSNIYQPTGFTQYPRNIVGAYNPGYQAAFAGYSNPYMGYGYSGYGYGGYPNNPYYGYGNYSYGEPQYPIDEESRLLNEAAMFNGVSYSTQLENESDLYKQISRIVSKNVGRDEEEAERCEAAFSIYDKRKVQQESAERRRTLVQTLTIEVRYSEDSKVIVDSDRNYRPFGYRIDPGFIDNCRANTEKKVIDKIVRNNYYYDHAPERQFDKMDLLDFFNNGFGRLALDSLMREQVRQAVSRTTEVYNREEFGKLLRKNGHKTKEEMKIVDRFFGRYGIMPDGRPTTPGLDPAVATSFSYDPKTGSYYVTAPNFMKSRMDQARDNFIKSIDKPMEGV